MAGGVKRRSSIYCLGDKGFFALLVMRSDLAAAALRKRMVGGLCRPSNSWSNASDLNSTPRSVTGSELNNPSASVGDDPLKRPWCASLRTLSPGARRRVYPSLRPPIRCIQPMQRLIPLFARNAMRQSLCAVELLSKAAQREFGYRNSSRLHTTKEKNQ